MIICAYCGTGNPDTAGSCEKCGAPRLHAFPQSTMERALSFVRMATSSTSDDQWPVRGYDSSSWNGEQNGVVTKTKAQFGFIRAGYGNKGYDPRLDYYRRVCLDNGIEFGLYWYVKAGLDWREHANAFYTVWKAEPGKLPPVLDCEYSTLDKQGTSDWIFKLVRQFEQLSGKKVMIYTSPGWWNGHCSRADWPKYQPLWVAHWTTAAQPTLPWDWGAIHNPKSWEFWQHSADGNKKALEYGFMNGDNDLDLNRYNGSIAQFNIAYGTNIQPIGSIPPQPMPDEIVPLYRVQVSAGALNVRSLPVASSKDLGDLQNTDILPVVEERDGWCRVEGWISSAYVKKV